ncbi:MAG: cobalamin biosynthesis protein [Synergistaceae bacterium]|nr:cobalamin biosynthesis protein [Synergistaceae bacterium]
MNFALILSLAILIDNILGDPKFLYHPVIFIGKIVKLFSNTTTSFIRGLVTCISTVMITGSFVFLILYIFDCNLIIQVYLLYSALAWRDLKDETEKIYTSLINDDIINARKFLSYVVGRDTENLNFHEIVRATIETIAENSIDGIISVIFFAAVGYVINQDYGMCVCVWIFKASSTLDSMIGYEHFGKFGTPSARLDDILNFIPARLGGIFIILSGMFHPSVSLREPPSLNEGRLESPLTKGRCLVRDREVLTERFRIFFRDRKNHSSPNSAHGESAFAGVLNIRLGGAAFYNGKLKFRKFINVEANDPEPYDILRAWKLLDVSCSMFSVFAIILLWKI